MSAANDVSLSRPPQRCNLECHLLFAPQRRFQHSLDLARKRGQASVLERSMEPDRRRLERPSTQTLAQTIDLGIGLDRSRACTNQEPTDSLDSHLGRVQRKGNCRDDCEVVSPPCSSRPPHFVASAFWSCTCVWHVCLVPGGICTRHWPATLPGGASRARPSR